MSKALAVLALSTWVTAPPPEKPAEKPPAK